MSGIVLGVGATTVNKTKFLLSRCLQSSGERQTINKEIYRLCEDKFYLKKSK